MLRHPATGLDFLPETLGLDAAERRRIRREAKRRASLPDRIRRRAHPDGLEPPRRRAFEEAIASVAPWCIGIMTLMAGLAFGFGAWLGLVLLLEVAVGGLLASAAIGRAFLPWQWCLLRERGHDVCLACGSIGAGRPDAGATRCPECGHAHPPRRGPIGQDAATATPAATG